MANFRSNHATNRGGFGKSLIRLTIVAVLFILLVFAYKFSQKLPSVSKQTTSEAHQAAYLPTSTTGQVVIHDHFALSYNENYEQAEWVAYRLTREQLTGKKVSRTDDFRPDNKISTGSATPDDFRRSGYDRGHLVPAGDRTFSYQAMSETFLMSNISPQNRAFNHGVWRELEENTRYWAKKFKELYIVSGPVFGNARKRIGRNGVLVPEAYFKVLLDISEPELKAIAFLIPNELSVEHLKTYAISIDDLEAKLDIDFFPGLMKVEMEEQLERSFDISLWSIHEPKYQLRLKKWNNVAH